MRCARMEFDEDIRLLVDIAVSQFRTHQILSQTRASIAETREFLREIDRLVSFPADDSLSFPPLASPREPE